MGALVAAFVQQVVVLLLCVQHLAAVAAPHLQSLVAEPQRVVAIPADTQMMVHVMNQLTVHQALILLIVAKQYSPVVVAQPTAAVIRMIAKQYSQISHIGYQRKIEERINEGVKRSVPRNPCGQLNSADQQRFRKNVNQGTRVGNWNMYGRPDGLSLALCY